MTKLALFLAGGVIAVGAVLLGVGLRFAVADELPRIPWSAALLLGGLLIYAAQSLLWMPRRT